MTEATTNQMSASEQDERTATAKSHRVTTVAWLAGVTAVVALGTMNGEATIGAGLGVIGVSGMVALVCHYILRDR